MSFYYLHMQFCLFTGMMLCFTSEGWAQSNPMLEKFSGFESGGKVHLSWVIKAGNTCDGVIITRATDSVNFYTIGEIPGVCGSISQPESYAFTDEKPVFNTLNYYRLQMGSSGYSGILSFEVIDLGFYLYKIRPHPVLQEAKVYFQNPRQADHELLLYGPTGNVIGRIKSGTSSHFDLGTGHLASGLYHIVIIDPEGNDVLSGPLLISH